MEKVNRHILENNSGEFRANIVHIEIIDFFIMVDVIKKNAGNDFHFLDDF